MSRKKEENRQMVVYQMRNLIVSIAEYVAQDGANENDILLLEQYVRTKIIQLQKEIKWNYKSYKPNL